MAEMDFIPGIDPSLVAEATRQESEKKKDEARTIESLDNFTMSSWGYSSPLKITQGNKIEFLKFKLKSVGVTDVMSYYSDRAPTPPSMVKTYKRDSDVARSLNSKHDIAVREINEADENYIRAKNKHDQESGAFIVLSALAYNLKYKGAVVMEGEDIHTPNKMIDPEGALLALRQLGLSSSHYAEIMRNLRELTEEVEKNESFL